MQCVFDIIHEENLGKGMSFKAYRRFSKASRKITRQYLGVMSWISMKTSMTLEPN